MRLLFAALLALATPAFADEPFVLPADTAGALSTQGVGGPALGFTLRGGVAARPSYSGSDEIDGGADIGFALNYLRLGRLQFGDPDPLFVPEGLGVTGSLRYVPERDDDDDPELAGLDDVDGSLELGVGLRYARPNWQVFGNVRYGVIGHESFVGELGGDVFLRPSDRWTLRAGPRVLFGDSDYASTYYGVNAIEAGNSTFTEFDADGGLLSAGVEVGAAYRINDSWGVDAALTYERLQNDAADSPITEEDTQIRARIGVTRRFTLGF